MYTVGCSKRRRIPHDVGPNIYILQIASDGGSSLYQIQVNSVPDGELHMEILDSGYSALIKLEKSGNTIDTIRVDISEKNWLYKAHRAVEDMLRGHYGDAIIGWYTRGANVER